MKVARVDKGFGLNVEFHAPGPAQRHCTAVTWNANYYELALVHSDVQNTQPTVYEGECSDMIDTIDEYGHVAMSDGPGLGVEYDWKYIEGALDGPNARLRGLRHPQGRSRVMGRAMLWGGIFHQTRRSYIHDPQGVRRLIYQRGGRARGAGRSQHLVS